MLQHIHYAIIIAIISAAMLLSPRTASSFEVVNEESGQAQGKDGGTVESTIVVTGTKTRKEIRNAPIRTDVLKRDKIEATNSASLFESLNGEMGIVADNQCQNCGANTVSINGLEGNYTQFLVNGFPTVSSLAGVYLLQQFPSELIDRVEIVRGGGSALYGSGAIGGVINVITRKPVINEANISYKHEFLQNNKAQAYTVSGYASAVSRNGKAGIAVYGTRSNRDSWDANHDGFSDLCRSVNNTFGASGFFSLIPGMELTYNVQSIHEDRRGGDFLDREPFFSSIREQAKTNRTAADFKLEHRVNDYVDYSVYGAASWHRRNTYYGPAADPYDPANLADNVTLFGVTWNPYYVGGVQANVTPLKDHTVTVGYEFTSDKIEDHNPGMGRTVNANYRNHGAYLQYDWDLKRVELVAGARVDKNSEMNHAVFSPRGSAIFRILENLRLRGSVASGYKSPQVFDEDFHIEVALTGGAGHNQVIVNHPNLKAERSMSYSGELDADFSPGDFVIQACAGGFYTTIRDKMEVDYSSPYSSVGNIDYYLRDNVAGDSRIVGANAELKVMYKNLARLTTSATWIAKSELAKNQIFANRVTKHMLRVPEVTGYSMLQVFIQKLTATFSVQYIGRQWLEHEVGLSDNLVHHTRDFFVPNAKLQYRFDIDQSRYLDLFVGVENITDSYQGDLDYGTTRDAGYIYGPIKPRTYFLGMKAGFM
ncbi:MAG: TonB-dependent receptor [Spirochaetes bacterium]|nr:TonB-dependent receptor [Spirochaetota bacterium]